jgi:PQQ-dependent catabolism-associated CXXCW motif protein
MKRFARIAGRSGAALLFSLALSSARAAEPVQPAVVEPGGFWTGPLHGRTPAGLAGGSVIDAPALAGLIASERPLLLDVAARDVKPAGLPADALWRPIHRSIPDSVWMPGAGAGDLDPAQGQRFAARIQALTMGARDRPIVVFCHPDCWASWNAAKRLVLAGYKRVYWFRDGVEGWQDARETGVVVEDPAWASGPRPAGAP